MVTLSIIILNYNTGRITLEAIKSIEKNYPRETMSGDYEVIVADNASPDNSLEIFKTYKTKSKIKKFLVVDNKKNAGFASGNNLALKHAHGDYVLLLNPDTLVPAATLSAMVAFLKQHPDAGAATCRVILPGGELDQNCLRGFPTPWNSLCHFSGIARIFPRVPFFSGYLQSGWRNLNSIQQVDAIEGAFIMTPRKIGEQIGWLDEDYFFYGEDLQFCYDIHRAGYKVYYVPEVNIVHYGGVSSGIKKQSQSITTANIETKKKVQGWRFDAMRIFFQKNYSVKYPRILNTLVSQAIDYMYKKNINKLNKMVSN